MSSIINGKVNGHTLATAMRHTRFDPVDAYAYSDKFAKNTKYNPTTRKLMTACPACAEPNFLHYDARQARQALAQGATCGYCGRTMKQTIIDLPNGKWSYEWLLVGGRDAPEYLAHQLRRPEDFGVKREDMKT